ncbi:hypothetical protein HY989_05430 [Candidatus Micrarchaeota archaeon]|nr:hypothetical protein [Candidatus Micrarchaeota archaeon]
MGRYFEYGILFLMIGVLALGFFSFFSAPKLQADSQGKILQTASNSQYYQQKAQAQGTECGDLKDAGNVQHLSHHPSKYADCLKKVDLAFLKQATGKTLGEIMG